MRDIYPLSSEELNDTILLAQEQMIYLIGIDTDGVVKSGLYDYYEEQILDYFTSLSGVPHIAFDNKNVGINDFDTNITIKNLLEFDYIIKKHLGYI